ncbi:TolB family protein [Candidatus Leptofilum sp.]|uniref:TolB family protein n=1 Tax=Candidatus Leptofilum sp. TaxID=3241576 RepID=UPI003B58F2C5
MKFSKTIVFCLIILGIAACRPASSGPPQVTPTAVPPTTTPATNEVEVAVTRIVVTAEPTATPAPCTPLPTGMHLAISMAEQERTILINVEGLLPEDKPVVLLNGRSAQHGSRIEFALANPVGANGRYQDSYHLGENDIMEWSGQIIHQRGAVCFEFTLPLTEPLVLEAAAEPAATPEAATPNQSSGTSNQPVISADGSVIAFTSLGALTPGSNPDWAAYAYDASSNQLELLSIRHDGLPAYDAIYAVALSADGRFAAYYSFDGETTPEDPDICTDGDWSEPCEDLYIYDRQTGEIERIPVGRSSGLGKSYTISLSADGRFVAYEGLQIYDRETGEMLNIFTEPPNGATFAPVFAANGDIAFVSGASNLVPNDVNETFDVFVWEAVTGQISRVSIASDGSESDDVSGAQPLHEGIGDSLTISADGRFVAFTSLGTGLTADELSQCDDYRGFTRTCYAIYLHDRQTGKTRLVINGDGDSAQPSLSADGRYLVFSSMAQNLLPNTPPCDVPALTVCGHIYLLDTQTGELQLLSQSVNGDWGDSGSTHPQISADGRIITFSSDASNLVPNDTNAVSDIFRYDSTTGEMVRVSLVNR